MKIRDVLALAAPFRAIAFAGAISCAALTSAEAETWHFDITSTSLTGFFEVDATAFVIPISAVNPSNIPVTAADLVLLNSLHYTPANIFIANCTPGECVLDLTKNNVFLGLGINPIWLPWNTPGTQHVVVSWVIGGLSVEDGVGVRTVELVPTPLPAALPLFATGLGVLGLLGWRRKRQQAG